MNSNGNSGCCSVSSMAGSCSWRRLFAPAPMLWGTHPGRSWHCRCVRVVLKGHQHVCSNFFVCTATSATTLDSWLRSGDSCKGKAAMPASKETVNTQPTLTRPQRRNATRHRAIRRLPRLLLGWALSRVGV